MDWLRKQSVASKKKLILALFVALIMQFFIGVTLVFAQQTPFYFEDFEDNSHLFTTFNQSWGGIADMSGTTTPDAYSGTRAFKQSVTFAPDYGGFHIDDDPLKPNATTATTSDVYVETYVYIPSTATCPSGGFNNDTIIFAMELLYNFSNDNPNFLQIRCGTGAINNLASGAGLSNAPIDEWFKVALEYDYQDARLRGYINDELVREALQSDPTRNYTGAAMGGSTGAYFDDWAYYDGVSFDTIDNPLPPEFDGLSEIDFNTRFTDATATGTASTSISVDVDYFLDTTEFDANTKPDYISIVTLADGFFNDQQVAVDQRLILPLSDGAFTKNIPLEYIVDSGGFVDGNYISFINFYNINSESITFDQTSIELSFEISGGAVVDSNVQAIYNGEELSTSITYRDCSLTSIGGCFINALIFTFVPDTDALDKFTGVWQAIEDKPPFGYVTSLVDALGGSSTTTPAFDFGTIPFVGTIFDPFKLLLATALWFIYGLFLLGRMDKLDI